MNGELWQPCEQRGCRTEPVCADCFRCAAHCACTEQPTHPQPPPPHPADLTAQWAAFRANLGASVMCEGERLTALTLGADLGGPPPPPPPAEDALDELTLIGLTLTPGRAFELLTDEINVSQGFTHTGNQDVHRQIRQVGRAHLIDLARSVQHQRLYGGTQSGAPLYPNGERETQDRYGVPVTWLAFQGYARWSAPRPPGLNSSWNHLYLADDGTWWLGTYAAQDLHPLTDEQARQLHPDGHQ